MENNQANFHRSDYTRSNDFCEPDCPIPWQRFVETFTERLLTYALGRGVEEYDHTALRKIARGAAADNQKWSSIILGIVNSTPFQMRRASDGSL